MTLDELERPLRTLFQITCVFGAHHENLNEDRLNCLRRKCSTMTLVSGNIRFMRIFAGVPWRGGVKVVKRQSGNRKRRFSVGRYIFGTVGNKPTLIM